MDSTITTIKNSLASVVPAFIIEDNKSFEDQTCTIYANRKAGMAGQDFLFVFEMDKTGNDKSVLQKIHESARKYANSFYKMPKWLRFSCPNIISIFVSAQKLSDELTTWAEAHTRTMSGGEFHSIFMVDLAEKAIYGQGKSVAHVHGIPFTRSLEFKNIDPQNRAFYTVASIADALFQNGPA